MTEYSGWKEVGADSVSITRSVYQQGFGGGGREDMWEGAPLGVGEDPYDRVGVNCRTCGSLLVLSTTKYERTWLCGCMA